MGAHSTSDDPSGYRSADEEKEWFEKDPVNRMKNWLIKLDWWDEETDMAEYKTFRSEILAELKLAEQRPKAPFQDMISDVYKRPPAHLKEQLASLEAHVAKYPDNYRAHGEGGL